MAQHNLLGTEGEAIAADLLLKKGYVILEKNWRYKRVEIDLIARKNNTLIFVEVKTLTNENFGFPEEQVHPKKQKNLAEAAEAYIVEKDIQSEIRFDIIAITKKLPEPEIFHIRDAFFPEGDF